MSTQTIKVSFAPAPGSGIKISDATIIGTELKKIEQEEGAIKPSVVVDRSRPTNAPLHAMFEWDDAKAAELHRIDEARKLIRSVVIVRDDMPKQEQAVVRAFANVRASADETKFEGQAYISTERAAENPDYRQQILNQAMGEIKAWRQRYDNIREFVGIYAEIESVEKNISFKTKAR